MFQKIIIVFAFLQRKGNDIFQKITKGDNDCVKLKIKEDIAKKSF